jgi:hypothetical protein
MNNNLLRNLADRRTLRLQEDHRIGVPTTTVGGRPFPAWKTPALDLVGYTLVNAFVWFNVRSDTHAAFYASFIASLVVMDGAGEAVESISQKNLMYTGPGSYTLPLLSNIEPVVASQALVILSVDSEQGGVAGNRILDMTMGSVIVAGQNTDLRR